MNSPLKNSKRDEALERLAIGITEGAKNCAIVIKNINIICQDIENYPNPFELINEWLEHLFTNKFNDLTKNDISRISISVDQLEELADSFFNYFASLTPFYYENRKIKSNWTMNREKYKWTK